MSALGTHSVPFPPTSPLSNKVVELLKTVVKQLSVVTVDLLLAVDLLLSNLYLLIC